jgi:bacteriorhodopsin
MRNAENLLATLTSTVPIILFLTLLFLVSWWFKPPFWLVVFVLITYQLTSYSYKNIKNKKRGDAKTVFKMSLSTIVVLWVLFYLSGLLGGYGLLGLILLGVIISIYILWRQKTVYMYWIEHIEREFLYGGKTATELKKKKRQVKKNGTSK